MGDDTKTAFTAIFGIEIRIEFAAFDARKSGSGQKLFQGLKIVGEMVILRIGRGTPQSILTEMIVQVFNRGSTPISVPCGHFFRVKVACFVVTSVCAERFFGVWNGELEDPLRGKDPKTFSDKAVCSERVVEVFEEVFGENNLRGVGSERKRLTKIDTKVRLRSEIKVDPALLCFWTASEIEAQIGPSPEDPANSPARPEISPEDNKL